jgi:hypothetical protein
MPARRKAAGHLVNQSKRYMLNAAPGGRRSVAACLHARSSLAAEITTRAITAAEQREF